MRCQKGIKLKTGNRVPCGQCINCRINKGRKWTARLMLEWMMHPQPTYFLTLTYSDEHVPKTAIGDLTLRKKASRQWVNDTARDRYAGSFRYYLVGEYGDRTGRPHLHMAIFPRSDRQVAQIVDRWKYGFTTATEFTQQRAAYLCQYTTKKLTAPNDERLNEGMEPEFRTSSLSPPIGAASISALLHPYRRGAGKEIVATRGDVERSVRIGGKVFPLDAYILRRMRLELGIPLTHVGRMDANPNYLDWHETQEAEWNPKINEIQEYKHAQKKAINATRRAAI